MQRAVTLTLLLLALAGYSASLFLPVFECELGDGVMGYHVLMFGWFELFALDPRWLANLTAAWLVVAMIRDRRGRDVIPLALLTLALAIGSAWFPTAGCGDGEGAQLPSLGLQPGGYLWVGAVSLIALCACATYWRARSAGSPYR